MERVGAYFHLGGTCSSITLEICMDFYMTFDYGKRQFDDVNNVKRSGRSSWWALFFCFGGLF